MRILSTERQTVKILDEYADRERRKVNIIIHNLPESAKEKLQDRNEDDIKRINEMIEHGTGVSDVKITKLIRLGGRGQNQQSKPRLILATLDSPDRRRVILAAAKMLRPTDDWANIYISADLTPSEREKEKKLRQELRERRDAGERNLIIRSSQIVTRATKIATNQSDDGNRNIKDDQNKENNQ
jgi:hypothetical protein